MHDRLKQQRHVQLHALFHVLQHLARQLPRLRKAALGRHKVLVRRCAVGAPRPQRVLVLRQRVSSGCQLPLMAGQRRLRVTQQRACVWQLRATNVARLALQG
ncbi:MAG: hypothetical protein ACK4ZJ_17390, partial [Allorhizobium sp.]